MSEPSIFSHLTGASCRVVDCDGHLEPVRYKGDHAVCCTDCRTPAIRVWDHE